VYAEISPSLGPCDTARILNAPPAGCRPAPGWRRPAGPCRSALVNLLLDFSSILQFQLNLAQQVLPSLRRTVRDSISRQPVHDGELPAEICTVLRGLAAHVPPGGSGHFGELILRVPFGGGAFSGSQQEPEPVSHSPGTEGRPNSLAEECIMLDRLIGCQGQASLRMLQRVIEALIQERRVVAQRQHTPRESPTQWMTTSSGPVRDTLQQSQ
jgi:hypothetical protein